MNKFLSVISDIRVVIAIAVLVVGFSTVGKSKIFKCAHKPMSLS